MSIDWKKEAENRKDEMLADLKTMLEIESVRDESKGTPEAPLGPGPKEALDKFLEIGKRDQRRQSLCARRTRRQGTRDGLLLWS